MNIKIVNEVSQANTITHAGKFHADEVLSVVILSKILGEIRLFRTTNDVLSKITVNKDTIVFDIGYGIYDHHQKDCKDCRDNGVIYAAAGKIWRAFGLQICSISSNPDLLWYCIDRDIIQGVDAIDTGVMPNADYPAQAWNFSRIISSFNPNWNSSETTDEAFIKAVNFAEIVFDKLFEEKKSDIEARSILEDAIMKSNGHIMVLDQYIPWIEGVFASKNKKAKNIWFVVYPSSRGGYNWQCVPDALGSFGQRKPVPTEWKGLNGSAIQEITGISTATFCHRDGFIGGAATLEDAIALAKIAVNS